MSGSNRYWESLSAEQRAAHVEKSRKAYEQKAGERKSVEGPRSVGKIQSVEESAFDRAAATREQHLAIRRRYEQERADITNDRQLTALELRAAGAAIRSRRGRQKPTMSQETLAHRLDLDIFAVDLIERGRRQYGFVFLSALAVIFSCSAHDLLARGVSDIGKHAQPGLSPESSSWSALRS